MAIATKSQQPLYSALNLLTILQFLLFFPSEGTLNKHTTELIHRDSPLSPFYNPSSTHFDRLHNAFKRSLKRIKHLKSSKTQAPMKPGGGEYLMKISIGTPPVEAIGIVDTGSDLTWTQCLPCTQCYYQTIPLFDPTHSSSYHTIPCHCKFCNTTYLEEAKCDHDNTCVYSVSYGDGSYTEGNLAFETITVGTSNTIYLQNTIFGCAHNTAGIFDESGSGIIGLGGGNLSLISQLGTQISGGKKFSYCLVPTTINSTSKINFGIDSLVSDHKVVTTPLVTSPDSNLYLITLEGFSVGKERIAFTETDPDAVDEGNIVIDTGTTITFLPSHVYDGLESALSKVIKAERVSDPTGNFSLCYESVDAKIKIPIITAHFKGGNVNMKPVNTFSWVKKDVVCFAMISTDFPILGTWLKRIS